MTKEQRKSKIEQAVMNKISKEQVKMKPHFYYIFISILSIGFVVASSFVLAYSISIIDFWWRIQRASGPAYGARRNLSELLENFPWWAVILGILLIILAGFMVKKIGSLYKIKTIYLIIGLLVISYLIGWGLSYTSLPKISGMHISPKSCSLNDSGCYGGNGPMRFRQMK
jgi:hypothetical protein